MSVFDHQRLKLSQLQLDVEGLRRGIYTDKYFCNVSHVLTALSQLGYKYNGSNPRNIPNASHLEVGDVIVESQIFNRRSPVAMIAGIDVALAMLRLATGYYDDADNYVETWQSLEVDAVQDGDITYYDGDPEDVLTVIEIRGRYRDFAMLETPILGVLSRASRIATNVYEVLQVSNGKSILYFPARFDLPQTQMLDGYAYWLAVHRYNMEYDKQVKPLVSTDAQGAWWGGQGGGTIPHALIASFLADDVETMIQFARHIPLETPRILLADFNNDAIGSAMVTLSVYWRHYLQAYKQNDTTEMQRWTLNGVRLDTSGQLRDKSLDADEPKGVSPLLVRKMRQALNNAWYSWGVESALEDVAREFCRKVQIIVSGGFNREKVELFERARAPVDAYGVGSSFLSNSKETNTDFTMDVVRVFHEDVWHPIAKVGRRPCDNPNLRRIDLNELEA
jgi:nicotinate phosphoribosyltransferase